MGIVDKFLSIFKNKEVVNEETVTEKVMSDNEERPIVVNDVSNVPVMVRADDFNEGSVAPEEYSVVDDDDDEIEIVIEETIDHGIDVSEGDDMTPIIMDVQNSHIEVEHVHEINEPVKEVESIEVVENMEETVEIIGDEEVIYQTEEVEVIEAEEDVEIL